MPNGETITNAAQLAFSSLSTQLGSEQFAWLLPQEMAGQNALPIDTLDVEYQFNTLREAWHREYGASSSPTRIANCSSYRRIVWFGDRFLRLILRDLEQRAEPDHWFAALREITGQDPVHPKDRGNRRLMAKAWLRWARAQGYVW